MLLRITLSFLLLTILPTALLSLLLPQRYRRLWLWLPAFVLLAGSLFLFFGAGYISLQPSVWRTRLQVAIICTAVPQLGLILFLTVGKFFSGKTRCAFHIAGGIVATSLLALLIYGLTIGQSRIVTREFVVADERIPASFDDYRIAVVSDLHVGTHHTDTAAIYNMVSAINATRPDLICLVGDLVNFSDEELAEFIPQLSQLRAPDGVISVMGNHDYLAYQAWADTAEQTKRIRRLQTLQRQAGWNVLLNENYTIHRNADSIVIAGCENESPPPLPRHADLAKTLAGTDGNAYRILLTHDPSHWRDAIVGRTDIPLTFSGHTHGMQFALPGGWSPASLRFKEWNGLYTVGQQRLFVTTGIGENIIPLRINMPPEVVLCTLRHTDR